VRREKWKSEKRRVEKRDMREVTEMRQYETGRGIRMTNKTLLTSPFSLSTILKLLTSPFSLFPKKLLTFLILLTSPFALLTILTCSNILSPPDNQPGPNPGESAEQGRVTVYIDGPGAGVFLPSVSALPGPKGARTLLPGAPGFSRYVITFTDPAAVKDPVTVDGASSGQAVSLDAGTWTVRVDGYVGTAPDQYRAASGTAPVTISNGGADSVTVSLEVLPIEDGAEPGTFAWNIDTSGVTGPIDAAAITLHLISAGLDVSSDIHINLAVGYTGAQSVPPGVYQLTITLSKGGKAAGINPTAHIFPRLSTEANCVFEDDDFVSLVMLAGTVAVRKPAHMGLIGGITINAYREPTRTAPPIGSAVVSLPAAFAGGTTGVSGEWAMEVPVSGAMGLDTDKTAYFTVSVEDDEANTYTAATADSGPIPDKGKSGLSLPISIYGIRLIPPVNGSLALVPLPGIIAAQEGEPITLTASANPGYTLMTGRPQVYKTGAPGTTVTVTDEGPGVFSFTMPDHDLTVEADIRSSAKAITAFSLVSPVTRVGVIDEAEKTITFASVPYGTDVTRVNVSITHTGASISPGAGESQDFTNQDDPVSITYRVTAEDETYVEYTVTVAVQGRGTVEFSYEEHPVDEVSGFTLNAALSVYWTANAKLGTGDTPLAISSGDHDPVQWYLDGIQINEDDTSRMFSLGVHTISARITIGGEVYSKEAEITIVQ
jgi:hypothetical protein